VSETTPLQQVSPSELGDLPNINQPCLIFLRLPDSTPPATRLTLAKAVLLHSTMRRAYYYCMALYVNARIANSSVLRQEEYSRRWVPKLKFLTRAACPYPTQNPTAMKNTGIKAIGSLVRRNGMVFTGTARRHDRHHESADRLDTAQQRRSCAPPRARRWR